MTEDDLPEMGLETTKRTENDRVPNNPHYVYTVRLPLESDEEVAVTYYDETGVEREAEGVVVQSFYQHFEPSESDPAPEDARYNIVMHPSDDHNSPVLALRSDEAEVSGYIGWITSIETESSGVLYSESDNVYPKFDRDVLEQIDAVEEGDRIALIWQDEDGAEHATGNVVDRNRGQPLHAVVVDADDGRQIELEYSHVSGSLSVMLNDDGREKLGQFRGIAPAGA